MRTPTLAMRTLVAMSDGQLEKDTSPGGTFFPRNKGSGNLFPRVEESGP